MSCQDFNNLIKLSDFLHFNEIWLMFQPFPMYETNAIQLHFLWWFFWYLSQWSGSICSIFCTRLYSKDIHCATKILQCNITLPHLGVNLKIAGIFQPRLFYPDFSTPIFQPWFFNPDFSTPIFLLTSSWCSSSSFEILTFVIPTTLLSGRFDSIF